MAPAPPAAPDGPRGRVPDFFIVGAPKCGTTSLHRVLRSHPQIFMPELKEPRFLAGDMRPRAGFADGPREVGYPQTLAEYLALFEAATPEQRVGEATTTYLWSSSAAESIAELEPEARIIAIVREPASFLRSLHLTFVKGRNEAVKDLRRAMALEPARREGKHVPRGSHRPQLLQYSEHVRYVEQLGRYRAHFPPERVLVLVYDDFVEDNAATVRRILRFLEVEDDRPLDTASENVTTSTVRSYQVKDVVHTVSTGRGPISGKAKAAVKALTTRRLRRGAIGTIQRRVVVTEPPPPDERFMLELRRRFKPEVVALSDHLERDLVSLWGYDKLD
jgi:Sulfotransferase family